MERRRTPTVPKISMAATKVPRERRSLVVVLVSLAMGLWVLDVLLGHVDMPRGEEEGKAHQ